MNAWSIFELSILESFLVPLRKQFWEDLWALLVVLRFALLLLSLPGPGLRASQRREKPKGDLPKRDRSHSRTTTRRAQKQWPRWPLALCRVLALGLGSLEVRVGVTLIHSKKLSVRTTW